jgi:hypothetical protein
MKTKLLGLIAAVAMVFSFPETARTATLTGDVISGSYDYPCDTCTLTGGFSYFTNPFVVVAPAAQTTLFVGNPVNYSAWNVYFGANFVTLTMAPAPFTNVSYSPDPYNGPEFTVLSGSSFGSITGLVVNNPDCVPCTPITASLSADGGTLFVNWEGAGGGVGDTITVDFSVGGPIVTPLPGALPLFATGLGGLGLLGWRRKRQAAVMAAA